MAAAHLCPARRRGERSRSATGRPLFLFAACACVSLQVDVPLVAPLARPEASPQPIVSVQTDAARYRRGATVRLRITNIGGTYVAWSGSCGLVLQACGDAACTPVATGWSGCPLCGEAREIPEPLFLAPASTAVVEWNQLLPVCDAGEMRMDQAVGEFRFALLVSDRCSVCRTAPDLMSCWLECDDKQWRTVFSNGFSLGGAGTE